MMLVQDDYVHHGVVTVLSRDDVGTQWPCHRMITYITALSQCCHRMMLDHSGLVTGRLLTSQCCHRTMLVHGGIVSW